MVTPGVFQQEAAGYDLRRLIHRSMLMDLADDVLLVLDATGVVLDANRAAADTHGVDRSSLIGTDTIDFVHPDSHDDYFAFASLVGPEDGSMRRRLKCRRLDGSILWLDVKASWSASSRRFYLVERDVSADVARTTELRELSERLARQALTDPLTGLHNRSAFDDRVGGAAAGSVDCLTVIDVDNFKSINDNHGHYVGDGLLRNIAGRLRDNVRRGDFLARIGGDEFIAILTGGTAGGPATRTRLSNLRAVLSEPHEIDGQVIVATCSLGATHRTPGEPGDSWYRRADAALYVSKRNGRNSLTLV
jgi:diguanylate cyclase (GGDEF)-like protein/PAS domain S-box-containing protein